MAQEKARASRARTKGDGESGAAAEQTKKARASARKGTAEVDTTDASTKRTAKQAGAKTARVETPTAKAASAKRKTPAAGKVGTPKQAPARKARRLVSVPAPSAETIAERAYLLWERGEPGDQMEHWLRAEAEFRAA